MTIQYDNLNSTISAVGSATDIPVNIQTKGTGGVNVLGSGTNLIQQSQALATSPWSTANGLTVTNNAAIAPDGTTTASKLAEPATTTNFFVAIQNPSTVAPSARYTHSFYAKAAERTQVFLSNSVSTYTVYFDLSLGTVVSPSGAFYISSTITNVGNGWYRCSVTFTASTSANPFYTIVGPAVGGSTTYSSTLGYGILVWGVQLEIGSVANTYIPTTTTAIYGTPTLTFSGVAGLGLQSDGSLYVQPAGTGALQAQPTTSTATGGNARGTNAVDWQTLRAAASRVASGSYSTISGGQQHTSSGAGAFVGGGYQNVCSAYEGVIVGGSSNSTNSFQSFIGGGGANTANGTLAVAVGGASNASGGTYNFIGGGFTNSGTSGSAVTTQSATMNGTTAVTLSGSNANIKVGQAITGNFISYPNTYVTAISGTSLTISQNASGSGTATLSFFTPFGTVVGGGNNQATGSYSFIGGGGDAGTAANRNVASGAWSTVCGGNRNTASGLGSFIGGNGGDGAAFYPNTASGVSAAIVCGTNNTVTGSFSFIGAGISHNNTATYGFIGSGVQNTVSGFSSAIVGGYNGNTRNITGNQVFPACVNPIANASGVSQAALLILATQTTDATATVLRSESGVANTTNQVILPNNSAYFFRGEVVSGVTGGGDTKGWTIEGVIKRGANAASTTLVGTPTVTSMYADVGAATWAIAVTADTTNGGLRVTFTGQLATTIRTVCQIRTTEMTF